MFSGKNKNKYISRFDYKDPFGWMVRIGLNQPWSISKFFNDSKHGSASKSFKAAKTYRDTQCLKLTKKIRERLTKPRVKGLCWKGGIFRYTKTTMSGQYAAWYSTYYNDDGSRSRKSFAVLKYGEKKAKKLASDFRKNGIKNKILINRYRKKRCYKVDSS